MIYRLLALNVDGTILQSNGKLHKSTKEAIEYVQQKGVYVTLVTSRSFASAKRVAKALKIDSQLITHLGSYISADMRKEPLLSKRIPEDVTIQLARFLESFPCQIRLVHEKFSLANKYKLNHNLLAKTVFTSGDPVFYSQQFTDSISETLAIEPISPPKIEVYFEFTEDLEDAMKAIEGMFTEVSLSRLNNFRLDVLPQGVSKLTGLIHLGDHLGIPLKEMVAIGDGEEDIEMIRACGLGVSMGNASFQVKKAADWVTRSNDQHGVSYMVREHFRKQQPIDFLKKMNIIKM